MCFSLAWLQQILVYLIIIGAVIALIKLVLPYALSFFGGAGSIVVQAVTIVLWAFVAIAVVYFIFALISCLLGASGGIPSLLPHR